MIASPFYIFSWGLAESASERGGDEKLGGDPVTDLRRENTQENSDH